MQEGEKRTNDYHSILIAVDKNKKHLLLLSSMQKIPISHFT